MTHVYSLGSWLFQPRGLGGLVSWFLALSAPRRGSWFNSGYPMISKKGKFVVHPKDHGFVMETMSFIMGSIMQQIYLVRVHLDGLLRKTIVFLIYCFYGLRSFAFPIINLFLRPRDKTYLVFLLWRTSKSPVGLKRIK